MTITHEELVRMFLSINKNGDEHLYGAWTRHGSNIFNHVVTSANMDSFLRWSTMVATMVVGSCPFTESEYLALPDPVKALIVDSKFGDPPMLSNGATSASYAHQAFTLTRWTEMTDIGVSQLDSIVEFGGGYGAMAVVARALGFRGEYTIYDIPEVSLLQRYYLDNVGCAANLIPITEWDGRTNGHGADLLIAAHSLSETSPDFIQAFFDGVDPISSLIAHYATWEGVDLMAFFDTFEKDRSQYDWIKVGHFHHTMSGHYYRVGVKRMYIDD